jgi:hydrogenase expression/formation protein HypC
MCLGVPGRIVAIDGPVATVDFWGVRREVRLDVVDEPVAIGDYVLNHVGYAIRRIPEREIGETLALYELLLREAERAEDGMPSGRGLDAMAADVRGEIAAAAPARARGGARGD